MVYSPFRIVLENLPTRVQYEDDMLVLVVSSERSSESSLI